MEIGRIAELANIKLERGKALVLVGAPGSGKTTFAGIISAMNGCCEPVSCSVSRFTEKFNQILHKEPDVVIVEEFQLVKDSVNILKPFIAGNKIQVEVRGEPSRAIPTPFFIITTTVAPELDPSDRRFNVVHI